MAKKNFEIRAFRNQLDDYLGSLGWLGIDYREGFKSDAVINPPTVSIRFLPSNQKSLQLGGKSGEKLIRRVVQIDCYMETEDRADAITDDIMDFIELNTILVKDKDEVLLGTLICTDTQSIYAETIPPLLTNPKVIRWRGIVRATMETHLYAP